MVAAAPQPQPHVEVTSLVHPILSGLGQAAGQLLTHSPILAVLLALAVVGAAVRGARRAMYSAWERDPVRLFSRADKAVILARAGHRCEHHFPVFGRCTTTTDLEADHIHPWSRGGHTALTNGQALCKRHNREKRANVPFTRQLRAIERRRAGYFPPGTIGAVSRRVVAESTGSRSAA